MWSIKDVLGFSLEGRPSPTVTTLTHAHTHDTLMSKLQSKRLIRTMKVPVKLSLGGGSIGSHAFSGRAPIRKPCREDIISYDIVRETHKLLKPKAKVILWQPNRQLKVK